MIQRSLAARIAVVVMVAAVLGSACATSLDIETQPRPPEPTQTAVPTATPTARPTATPEVSAAGIQVGQCFTLEELRLVGGTPLSCNELHIAEFFAVTHREEGAEASWPGLEVIQAEASDYCNDQFAVTNGVAGEVSALEILFFRPDPDTWDNGDRQIACFVQFPEPTTETLGSIDPQRAFGLVSTFALRTGDCITTPSLVTEVAVELAACTDPHHFEVFESVRMLEGEYPGDDFVAVFVDDTCGPSFEAYVGALRDQTSLRVERLFPTEQSWTDWDDRLVSCVIASAEPTVGSVEGSGL
ncbi:MAG: septum formation family protein [Acidimicrobiales bacterium]